MHTLIIKDAELLLIVPSLAKRAGDTSAPFLVGLLSVGSIMRILSYVACNQAEEGYKSLVEMICNVSESKSLNAVLTLAKYVICRVFSSFSFLCCLYASPYFGPHSDSNKLLKTTSAILLDKFIEIHGLRVVQGKDYHRVIKVRIFNSHIQILTVTVPSGSWSDVC